MSERRIIHVAAKFRVERIPERLVSGGVRERDIVVHPGAAVILPVLEDGRLVMIRNYRVTLDRELLELPAGTLDAGEAPDACAARELREETGYRAGRLEPLLTFYATPGFCTEQMHVFIATGLTPGPTQPEASEHIRVERFAFQDALAAIRSGAICDAKTIVALLYYDRYGASRGGAS